MSQHSFIQTYSGRKFDFRAPDPEAITIEDIAHALSQTCRFGAHTRRFYSVADHSVNVARIVAWKGGNAHTMAAALIHDASEAYLGDVVTPLKRMLPLVGEIEKILLAIMHRKFGIDDTQVDFASIKRADETMLVVEAKSFFNFPPLENWTDKFHAEPLRIPPHVSRSHREAELYFLAAAEMLLHPEK